MTNYLQPNFYLEENTESYRVLNVFSLVSRIRLICILLSPSILSHMYSAALINRLNQSLALYAVVKKLARRGMLWGTVGRNYIQNSNSTSLNWSFSAIKGRRNGNEKRVSGK